MENKDWDELFIEFENNKQCAEHILVFKNFLKKNYHPPVKMVESDESPYCPICTGCGEEGCCSPLNCTQDPNGYYCQTYLRDLKFGYKMYDEISKLLNEDPKYKDDVDVIFNKVYDKIYGVQSNIDEPKYIYSIDEVKILLEKQRELTASSLGISSAVYIYPKDYSDMKELMIKTPLVI